MASEVQDVSGKNVQSYLEQHKITALFESLMSKVVKECPTDPVEFLIGKLQAIQRQRRKSASPAHTSPSTTGLRSKMQVTGKSVTPKSTATTKGSKSAEGVTKSAGARPTRPRTTAGMMSSSTPALRKTAPTKTTPSKGAATPLRPISSTSGLKAPTSIPRPTSAGSRRPTTAPVASRASGSASVATRGRGSSAAKKESKPSFSSLLAKSPSSSTSSLSKSAHGGTKDKEKAKKPPPSPASKVKEERRKDDAKQASAEEISEFFGEAKKSSTMQLLLAGDSEDDSEFEAGKEERQSDSDESEGMEAVMRDTAKDSEFSLEELIQKRLRSKSVKKSRGKLLFCSDPDASTPPSLGYHSDSQEGEGTDDEEGAEVIEDLAALEDEGVTCTGLSRSKHKIAPPPPAPSTIDLKVVICSQCARVIADGEQVTEVSPSLLTHTSSQTRTLEGDFESASQIGSHTQFPQWEASSALDSEIGVGSRSRSHDASSDVTLQSCDSWGGLAPPTRVQPIPSDTDSELQLPAPPPLEGKTWLSDPPTPHDPHGWGSSH